jgi:hypothetical protein
VTWLAKLSVSGFERINSALFLIPPSILPLSTVSFFVALYLFLLIPYYILGLVITSPCFLHYDFLPERIKEKTKLLWSSDLLSIILLFNVNLI